MQRMYYIMAKMAAVTHHMDGLTHEMLDVTATLRDHIANFDDFFRPIRSYFYLGEALLRHPHLLVAAVHFRRLDGLDQIVEKFSYLTDDIASLDALLPQMLAQMPPMIATMTTMKTDDADHAQLDELHV